MGTKFLFRKAAAVVPDYYVSNTGNNSANGLTPETAWQTITAKINGGTFAPDDIIGLKGGDTFRETLIPPNAGTAGHPITVTSYGTGKAIISGADAGAPTTPVRDACIYDTDARGYWVIDGIELAYAANKGIQHDQWTVGGVEIDTPGWVVRNNLFTKCGLVMWGANTLIEDNELVGPQPLSIANDDGAIHLRGVVNTNCIIQRNTIYDFYSRGVWIMRGASDTIVRDNIIYNIPISYEDTQEGYGINFDGYGLPITGLITCTGNTIYDTGMVGVYLENCTGSSLVRDNLIHDTVTYGVWYKNYAAGVNYGDLRGDSVSGVVAYNIIYNVNKGVIVESCADVDIWNNVIDDGTGNTPIGIGCTPDGYVTGVDIRNNIFGSGFSFCLRTTEAWKTMVSAFDYNRVKTGDVIYVIGDTGYTLAELQTGSDALNCFTTDPSFVDDTNHNYHLANGSPCIDTGVNVGLTEDYDGVSVADPPEIGAYEKV